MSYRTHNFDHKIPKSRLRGSILQTLISESDLKCAKLCTNHNLCISYNFCHEKLCELSSEDIHTMNDKDPKDYIEISTGCVFVGMLEQTHPNCEENGLEKNIQNDTVPDLCNINLKRRDGLLQYKVNKVEIDTETEWKLISENKCSAVFHGGVKSCNNETVVLEWLFIHQSRKTWAEARLSCNDIGANLITRFNETNEHLILIGNRLRKRFWVGASDSTFTGKGSRKFTPGKKSYHLLQVISIS